MILRSLGDMEDLLLLFNVISQVALVVGGAFLTAAVIMIGVSVFVRQSRRS